ncbi:hypothetical protein D0Z00_001670 [Geotrichum galactomycetum]|uniref:Uncharacterized protein n=1 Tax=Geotrichum galactomycetum TaxID=27317 RepID=A0ACB6V6A6_9ASCO|nr:hypothetical protein D0Z00_001670 [Geotrichum candidum]
MSIKRNLSSAEITAAFKPRLDFPKYNVTLANFHGHHRVALQKMRSLAPQVNLVVEIRDSRAPISTRNGLFARVMGDIPRLILYSKRDLSSLKQETIQKWHPDGNALSVDCNSYSDVRKVLRIAKSMHANVTPAPPLGSHLLVTGMPNVGKSTFLNTLRTAGTSIKKKAAPTGGMAGVTRSISNEIKISSNPPIYIFDTPGVFVPHVKDERTMIALAITGAMRTSIVEPEIQADYLLYRLNLVHPDGKPYRSFLPHPTNNIEELLEAIWKQKLKPKQRGGGYNPTGAAAFWVDQYRQGRAGKVSLDNLDEFESASAIEEKLLDDFEMDFDEEARRWKQPFLF